MSLQSAPQSSNSIVQVASVQSASESVLQASLQPLPVGDSKLGSNLKVFLSTFLTILLAELGDKTQLTTLLLTAKSHAPWIVFAGAGTALVTTSLLGVWLGCWLAQRISAKTLETAAGILLLLISAQLFWEVFQL
jgi:Ca2+/H+ antiporter, TMEM165/GDT1 family